MFANIGFPNFTMFDMGATQTYSIPRSDGWRLRTSLVNSRCLVLKISMMIMIGGWFYQYSRVCWLNMTCEQSEMLSTRTFWTGDFRDWSPVILIRLIRASANIRPLPIVDLLKEPRKKKNQLPGSGFPIGKQLPYFPQISPRLGCQMPDALWWGAIEEGQ